MAWENIVTIIATEKKYIDFDFVKYRYRAYPTNSQSWKNTVALVYEQEDGNSNVVYVFTKDIYTPMYEGMRRGTNDFPLPSGRGLYKIGEASGTFTVEREELWTPPNIKMNINGAVKEFDKGWVNVNGQLKEIDKMWTNVNGVLREV